jgi:hypothetical protein
MKVDHLPSVILLLTGRQVLSGINVFGRTSASIVVAKHEGAPTFGGIEYKGLGANRYEAELDLLHSIVVAAHAEMKENADRREEAAFQADDDEDDE